MSSLYDRIAKVVHVNLVFVHVVLGVKDLALFDLKSGFCIQFPVYTPVVK